jgi:NAD(P)-dependent dehydrogenase (short-subunit alcohol dehydrogenase family)
MGKLDGRVALVTGSARGLGAGIAGALAAEGATVVCADMMDAAPRAAGLPAGTAGAASAIRLDVTDRAAFFKAVDGIVEQYGTLDILCNNAGVGQPIKDVIDTEESEIDKIFAVNVKGVINGMSAAARPMIRAGRGRIINTASQTGKMAWPGWGVYSASKFAVVGLTQVTALELAQHGITVNAILPGTMVTDMMYTGFGEAAKTAGVDRDDMIAEKAASIPLGRMGTAEDIGLMAAWIASDDSRFTTGAQFNLTGGEMVFF